MALKITNKNRKKIEKANPMTSWWWYPSISENKNLYITLGLVFFAVIILG